MYIRGIMREEACVVLAALMMQRFPSLIRAYVVLDQGSVDLRMYKDIEFMPVFAGDAHAAIAPAKLKDLCATLYKTCSDLARTDTCPPPCHK